MIKKTFRSYIWSRKQWHYIVKYVFDIIKDIIITYDKYEIQFFSRNILYIYIGCFFSTF